ncbi:MAG: SURF1 family protein [Arenibacterium sp.]
MGRLGFLLIFGVGGAGILLALGVWQIQRLEWKQDLLGNIESRIAAEPVDLPKNPDPETDRYLPVSVDGRFVAGARPRMLASRRQIGAVHRHIAIFERVGGGRILVDIGWTEDDVTPPPLPAAPLTLTGNLDWPVEADSFTPEPDISDNFWFARDVPGLAAAYNTDEVLLVLRENPEVALGATPWPVDTVGIPNDHLQYAITWFSLAAIWIVMTGFFLRRPKRRPQR